MTWPSTRSADFNSLAFQVRILATLRSESSLQQAAKAKAATGGEKTAGKRIRDPYLSDPARLRELSRRPLAKVLKVRQAP